MQALMDNSLWRACARIPHLKIDVQHDAERLQAEWLELAKSDVLRPYHSKYPPARQFLAENWSGVSLYSEDGGLYSDVTENIHSMDAKATPVMEHLPYVQDCLEKIGAYNRHKQMGIRTRIMRVKAHGRLTWHSHMMDGTQTETPYAIIHIPIICPPEVRYSVIPLSDFRRTDYGRGEKLRVFERHYGEGQTWSFNYVHMHNVFNDSDVDRITIMAYVDLRVLKTKMLFEKALAKYDGPLMEEVALG